MTTLPRLVINTDDNTKPMVTTAIDHILAGSFLKAAVILEKNKHDCETSQPISDECLLWIYALSQSSLAISNATLIQSIVNKADTKSKTHHALALMSAASSLEKAKQFTEALKMWNRFFTLYPQETLHPDLETRIAQTQLRSGDIISAIHSFKKTIATNPRHKTRHAQVFLAEALLNSTKANKTDENKALGLIIEVLEKSRNSRLLVRAFNALVDRAALLARLPQSTLFILLDKHIAARSVEEAERVIVLIKNSPEEEIGPRRAKLFYRKGDYPQALELYRRLAELQPIKDEMVRWQSRTLLAMGRSDDAIAVHANHAAATDQTIFWYRAGWVAQDQKKYGLAEKYYARYLKSDPSSAFAKRLTWPLGWGHYRRGNFEQVKSTWAELPNYLRLSKRTRFWLEHLGKSDDSKPETPSLSYYSILRNLCTNDKDQAKRDSATHNNHRGKRLKGTRLLFSILTHRAALRLGIGYPPISSELSTNTIAKIRDEEDQLSEHYNLLMRRGYAVTRKVPTLSKLNEHDYRNSFPLAYPEILSKIETELGIDPLWVLAIARQESAFQIKAQSWVAAYGLMQIIPRTSEKIGRALGIEQNDSIYSLLDAPAESLYFGAWYLSQLLRRFHGHPALAVASYNAGPVAVGRWLKHTDTTKTNEFIEQIPYQETRDYVRKVISNYAHYVKLYRGADICIVENLPSSQGDTVDF